MLSRSTTSGVLFFFLLHHVALVVPSLAFSVSPPIIQRDGQLLLLSSHRSRRSSASSTALWESKQEELSSEETFQADDDDLVLQGADLLEFALSPHRPLGCTVEESLVSEIDKTKRNQHYVFVSKVTPGGFAEQAGLQVGDVVVGVSGIFGQLEDVQYSGIDRV